MRDANIQNAQTFLSGIFRRREFSSAFPWARIAPEGVLSFFRPAEICRSAGDFSLILRRFFIQARSRRVLPKHLNARFFVKRRK